MDWVTLLQLQRYGQWCEECLQGMCSDLRLDARCLLPEEVELPTPLEDVQGLAIKGFLSMNLPSPWFLKLDDCRISDAQLLAEGLKVNKTLRMLSMQRNCLGYRGLKAHRLGDVLMDIVKSLNEA